MRSIENLINRQLERWEKEHGTWLPSAEEESEYRHPKPVIAISPEFGCGSRLVTEMLSRRTGYDIYGFKLIDKVAENMSVRKHLIDQLDQRLQSYTRNLLDGILGGRHVEQSEYFQNLSQVLSIFVAEGGVILLGRGSTYMVPRGAGIRVRLVAPPELRIINLMRFYKINAREAEKRMITSDDERTAFIKKYYDEDVNDPNNYDMVINMDRISAITGTALIMRALGEALNYADSPRKRPRNIEDKAETVVKRQIYRWDNQSLAAMNAMRDDVTGGSDEMSMRLPVVALKPKFCCGTRLICEDLKEKLGYEIFGYRLIESVAKDMNLSPRIVDRLDQRAKSAIANLIEDLRHGSHVKREEYFNSLVRVVRALILQGGVSLLGRGAPFLTENKEGIRVHVTASRDKRLENMKLFYDIEGAQASEQIEQSDRERGEFARRYFNLDWRDPRNYDLSFNMDRLSPEGVSGIIQRSLEPLFTE
ncbi:MAG: AAA family ATPase [Candidatus Sumerlaeia bacterium]